MKGGVLLSLLLERKTMGFCKHSITRIRLGLAIIVAPLGIASAALLVGVGRGVVRGEECGNLEESPKFPHSPLAE